LRSQNFTFESFAQENTPKKLKSKKTGVKTRKKNVEMVKMHDFSSLGVQISRFCANPAKFCAVVRLHDCMF
tara:strand:- start:116 stop:328 length:213 start_codon:yes stop_codon:yes gene_type:complete